MVSPGAKIGQAVRTKSEEIEYCSFKAGGGREKRGERGKDRKIFREGQRKEDDPLPKNKTRPDRRGGIRPEGEKSSSGLGQEPGFSQVPLR